MRWASQSVLVRWAQRLRCLCPTCWNHTTAKVTTGQKSILSLSATWYCPSLVLPHALSREYILAKPVLLIFDHMLTGLFSYQKNHLIPKAVVSMSRSYGNSSMRVPAALRTCGAHMHLQVYTCCFSLTTDKEVTNSHSIQIIKIFPCLSLPTNSVVQNWVHFTTIVRTTGLFSNISV